MDSIWIVFETPYEPIVAGVFANLEKAKACKEIDPKFRSIQHWEKKEGKYVAENQAY
jgi:hypothetical protein